MKTQQEMEQALIQRLTQEKKKELLNYIIFNM